MSGHSTLETVERSRFLHAFPTVAGSSVAEAEVSAEP
jgi:hypothetical protein